MISLVTPSLDTLLSFSPFKSSIGTRKTVQHLRMAAALPEDPVQFPAPTLDGSQPPVTPAPGDLTPSTSTGTQTFLKTYR